jgi:hypothetical protein
VCVCIYIYIHTYTEKVFFNRIRFEVFTAVIMKNVAPCRYCVNRCFGGTYCLHFQGIKTCSRWFLTCGFLYLEDGGDAFLRNVGSHKIYTAPHPRDGILHVLSIFSKSQNYSAQAS